MHPINFLVDNMMLPILQKTYEFTGNYGWGIIFLTLIIRLALLPLTMQSHNSMKAMQKIQPKLKKIQERYKNKPEELNKKMFELYREHKVNPLGGCLPMIIQLPFLFALYASLIGDKFKEMLQATGDTSFLVLSDLSKIGIWHEGTLNVDNLILLAFFALSTVLQQNLMTPDAGPDADPRQAAIQKQMRVMMPIMITGMFLFFPVPTGIYLYLVISNIIGIIQYAFLNQQSARRDALEAQNMGKKAVPAEKMSTKTEPVTVQVTAEEADDKQKYRVKKGAKKKKRN